MYHNPPGSSKQEYWSRLPLPSPGDFADPTIEPSCPKCKQILYCLSHQGLGLVLTLYTQAWNTNRGNLKIFCSSNHFYTALEKAMAPHSTTLAWKIPWTDEPGRLQYMGLLRTQLSDFTFTFHFHALEKKMATHSSVLAWRMPGTGEPGGLPSLGSHRVGHDWSVN